MAVIAGGSRGIGLATARMLLAEKARVMIVGRSRERLAEAMAALGGAESALASIAADVTEPPAANEIRDAVLSTFGRVDALVNCAGSSQLTSIDSGPPANWYQQWELSVIAPKRLIDSLAPAIIEGGGGVVVNVASSAGRRPSATDAAYAVGKRGELALTQVYAERLESKGIRVLAVAPGPTETPLWTAAGGRLDEIAATTGARREEVRSAAQERLPMRRFASVDEVASVVLAALAGLGANGSVLPVDGGHVSEAF